MTITPFFNYKKYEYDIEPNQNIYSNKDQVLSLLIENNKNKEETDFLLKNINLKEFDQKDIKDIKDLFDVINTSNSNKKSDKQLKNCLYLLIKLYKFNKNNFDNFDVKYIKKLFIELILKNDLTILLEDDELFDLYTTITDPNELFLCLLPDIVHYPSLQQLMECVTIQKPSSRNQLFKLVKIYQQQNELPLLETLSKALCHISQQIKFKDYCPRKHPICRDLILFIFEKLYIIHTDTKLEIKSFTEGLLKHWNFPHLIESMTKRMSGPGNVTMIFGSYYFGSYYKLYDTLQECLNGLTNWLRKGKWENSPQFQSDLQNTLNQLNRLIFLASADIKLKKHYYASGTFENMYKIESTKIEMYLQQAKLYSHFIFNKNFSITDLLNRINILIDFISEIKGENEFFHQDANTLKALCLFIPKANPAFTLTNPETFHIVLHILKQVKDLKTLKKGLLYLDIFSPQEAKKLFDFYQKHQGQVTISKEKFVHLSKEEIVEWLYFYGHMRRRDMRLAKWALKHYPNHEDICLHALEWISQTKREVPILLHQQISSILKNHSSSIVKQKACAALWSGKQDPQDITSRNLLLQELLSTKEVYYAKTLLKSLAYYHFDEEQDASLLEALLIFYQSTLLSSSPDLAEVGVMTMLSIIAKGSFVPRQEFFEDRLFDRLLFKCKEIVESQLWQKYDQDFGLDNHFEDTNSSQEEVRHLKYPISQSFEKNRRRALINILDHFVSLYENLINLNFIDNEFNYQSIYLDVIANVQYYVPFIEFPNNKHLFRGLGTKHGQLTSQQAVLEALTQGCFTRSLDHASHDTGNWSKRQEELVGTFFTHQLESCLRSTYFNQEDGALIVISSDSINQDRKRMALRVEKESYYHSISFGGKGRSDFERIFLHPSWKFSIDLIAGKHEKSANLREMVKQYDSVADASIERKKRKKEINMKLLSIQSLLRSQSQKEIFKSLSFSELLDLHRHFQSENFLEDKVVFTEKVSMEDISFLEKEYGLKPIQEKEIEQVTSTRLQKLHMIQEKYYETTGVPFCLGQDQMLGLSTNLFNEVMPACIDMLSPLITSLFKPDKICPSTEERQLEIRRFEHQLMQFEDGILENYGSESEENLSESENNLRAKKIDNYLLRVLRLALLFKDANIPKLKKTLIKPSIQSFLGLQNKKYNCITRKLIAILIGLYQQQEKAEDVLLNAVEILCKLDKNLSQLEAKQLIKLFMD